MSDFYTYNLVEVSGSDQEENLFDTVSGRRSDNHTMPGTSDSNNNRRNDTIDNNTGETPFLNNYFTDSETKKSFGDVNWLLIVVVLLIVLLIFKRK